MKLKRKTMFIIIAVVVVMAIGSAVAYAWWTASATVENNQISTADAGLTYGGSGAPIIATNLIPQATLAADPADDPAANLTGYRVSYFWVRNTGDAPLHFYGWLDGGTGDYGALGSVVWVKITIAPTVANGSPWDPTGSLSAVGGPYLVYRGPINALYGKAGGMDKLTTIGHQPLAAGQFAFYKVVTWLDGPTCTNDSQNKSMTASLQFEGVSPESVTP